MNVLVTGGASGLGAAITKRLAQEQGNFIHFTFCRSEEKAKEIERQFSNTKAWRCDFADPASVTELTEKTATMRLNGLVNNAMTSFTRKHFHKLSREELAASFQKNVLSVVRLTQAAIEDFKKKRSGKIVTILSSALVGKPPIGWSEYVANKAYLLAMSKCWATEYAKFNVTANCVSPSFMLTDLNADSDERIVEELIKNSPQQRLLEPEEVAQAVHFLLHGSQQMNGVNLVINQGMDFA